MKELKLDTQRTTVIIPSPKLKPLPPLHRYIKEEGAYLVMMTHVASAVSPPICGFLTSLDFFRHHIPQIAAGIIIICAVIEAAVYFFLVDFGKKGWMAEDVFHDNKGEYYKFH